MRAFVTGITGFVGGFLAEHLLACGDEVLGCSRRGTWPDWAAKTLRDRAQVFAWDVGDGVAPEALSSRLAQFKPDCVFHLAALSVPGDCGTAEPTAVCVETNVRGTQRVLDLAASLPERPRIVFASTSHVYGRVGRDQQVRDEQAPLRPHRAYGKSKLIAENAVRHAGQQQPLDTIIVRAFQHTGPRQEPRLMLPEWAEQVARKSPRLSVKHLDTWVDVTDVRDVVRAYRSLAEHGERGGVYNVGCGMPRRTGELVEMLAKASEVSMEIAELTPGEEKFDPIADIRRVRADTGWQPQIEIEQTILDTLRYWRAVYA